MVLVGEPIADSGGTEIVMQGGIRSFERLAAVIVAASVLAATGCSSTGEPGTLTALDNRDGSTEWHSEVESSPIQVLVDGSVLVVAGVHDCHGNGRLAALDKATGETRWSVPFEGGYSESVAVDGVVVTATHARVVARRSTDGAQQWAADRFGEAQLQVAAGDQVLVIGANDAGPYPRDPAEVVLLDPDTGETRWVTSLDGAGQIVDVAIADDLAIVRTTGTSTDDAGATVVLGVSLSVGHIRWRHDLGISEVSKPLLVSTDNVVVDLLTWGWASDEPAGAIENDGGSSAVVVLETGTGFLRWRIDREFHTDDPDPEGVESYSLSGGELAGRLGSDLVVWDLATAEGLWSVPHAGGDQPGGRAWIAGARVISGTPVMVGNDQARLDTWDLPSGVEQWSKQLPGDVAAVASDDDESWVATWGQVDGCD